ncbi:MAG: hypothetical protein QM786_18310 [Breznakibacter sp.]
MNLHPHVSITYVRNWIAFLILVFINALFAYKYVGRVIPHAELPTLALAAIQIGAYTFRNQINWPRAQFVLFAIPVILWVLAIVYSHYFIPLTSLNVDRWSVIDSFLKSWESGHYPYYAESHVGNPPGPMPFYFLIAYPFVQMGELSWLSFIGYAIMVYWAVDKTKATGGVLWVYLLTCLFALWELAVRSNMFINATLVLLLMHFIERHGFAMKWSGFVLALFTGFLLSTRSVFALAYLVFFVSYLYRGKAKISEMCIFGIVAVVAFCLTFFPLIIRFPKDFFMMNPFIVQSSFLIPLGYTVSFFLIAIVLGFVAKTKSDRIFYAGVSLFVPIAIYFVYHVVGAGFVNAYLNSIADISYFILCTPFFLYYLGIEKSNL